MTAASVHMGSVGKLATSGGWIQHWVTIQIELLPGRRNQSSSTTIGIVSVWISFSPVKEERALFATGL